VRHGGVFKKYAKKQALASGWENGGFLGKINAKEKSKEVEGERSSYTAGEGLDPESEKIWGKKRRVLTCSWRLQS